MLCSGDLILKSTDKSTVKNNCVPLVSSIQRCAGLALVVLALVAATAGHLISWPDLKSEQGVSFEIQPLPSRAENSAVVPAFASSTMNARWPGLMAQF